MRYWAPTAHHVSGRMPWQVINEGARDCLRDIISSCHGPRTLQRVLELYSGKHNVIRTRAMEGILQMLQAPPLLVLGPLSISHARDSRKCVLRRTHRYTRRKLLFCFVSIIAMGVLAGVDRIGAGARGRPARGLHHEGRRRRRR